MKISSFKTFFSALMFWSGTCCPLRAEITLPPLIGNHMVLQRGTTILIWGKSTSSSVEVFFSWNRDKLRCPIDKEGNWKVSVRTGKAGGPYFIRISDKDETVRIEDVMIGEVWYCSGQSNMAMPVQGLKAGQLVENSTKMLVESCHHPNLRVFGVDKIRPEYHGNWEVSAPENVMDFSAIGFEFGRRLNDFLGIPVGMICAARGGTRIEIWSSEEDLATYPQDEIKTRGGQNSSLYHSLVLPMSAYQVRGFLWYQGESNHDVHQHYASLMKDMIERWRKDWGSEKMPFFYVQVAPSQWCDPGLREQQEKAREIIPYSGMVSAIDVGEEHCIHPRKKEVIAERLFLQALSKVYDIKVPCESPYLKSIEIKEDSIYLEFHESDNGLVSTNGFQGFEIAGEDGCYYPARADYVFSQDDTSRKTKLNGIIVRSETVDKPVNVRYCYDSTTLGNVYNTGGFPLLPFRTDTLKKIDE